MVSTVKVTNIDTPDNTGNITFDRPIAGDGSGLTSLSAANLTGTLPAIDGSSLTGVGVDGITSSANATAISIDANEIVTMPLQPAFSASMSHQLNITVGAFVKVLFDTEIFDQNADFNTSTNTFTAPVSGRYLFTMFLECDQIDTASSALRFDLVTSNDSLMGWNRIQPNVDAASDYRLGASGSILANMDANDTASVQVYVGGGQSQLDIYSCCRFEGVLIC